MSPGENPLFRINLRMVTDSRRALYGNGPKCQTRHFDSALSRSEASNLLKYVLFAARGHEISAEIGVHCRPSALTGRLFQQAAKRKVIQRPLREILDARLRAIRLGEGVVGSGLELGLGDPSATVVICCLRGAGLGLKPG